MVQAPSIDTRRAASRADRPDINTRCTSGSLTSRSSTRRVIEGTMADCGRDAMGDNVPSMSSKRTSGRPERRSNSAGLTGSAGVVTSSYGRRELPRVVGHDLCGARENRLEPIEDVRMIQVSPHTMHATPPLIGRHLERLPNGLDEAVDVERIDEHRAVDLLRGAGEATENQDAAFVQLAGDKLLRDEVHAILKRRDDADITGAVHRGEQISVDIFVDENDRRPLRISKSLIDGDDRIGDVVL